MTTDVVTRAEIGARLKRERDRFGCSQEEFGLWGGVSRNSQQAYEAGRRPFDVDYLLALSQRGVDVAYAVTGSRPVDALSDQEHQLLASFAEIGPIEREGLVTVATAMAGRVRPHRLHASPSTFHAEPPALPSQRAMTAMFEGLLAATGHASLADELAHELATLLPSALASARDALPDRVHPPANRVRGEDDRGSPQARRS